MVVLVGLTLVLSSTASVPLVPGMETAVAPVVVHSKRADPPELIDVGEALKESITGQEDPPPTVTVAVAVVLPAVLVAVSV